MDGQDLFIVVHDKVYDATKFVDEHPYVLPLSFLAIRLPLSLPAACRAIDEGFCEPAFTDVDGEIG